MPIRRARLLPILAALLFLPALAACTGRPDGVEPVQPFAAERYVGRWYEIARLDHRFERGLTNVTAEYALRPDGTVSVVNQGFDPAACAWKRVEGTASFQEGPEVPSLSVTFFWPFAGGYHVFALDGKDYGWAAVSGPTTDYFWILARGPDLAEDVRRDLVDRAAKLGFAMEELILVDHAAPRCADGRPAPAPPAA